MKAGPHNKEEFLALLVRRKWWIALPFVALSIGMALFVYVLPSAYVSEVLIIVRPRDIPEVYVPDVVGNSEQRLAAIQRTILSRSYLEQIVEEYADELAGFEGLTTDEKVVRLRGQIDIDFETETGYSGVSVTSLRIAYQNRSARVAQAIAQELTDGFIAEDSEDREGQVLEASDWLKQQLADVEQELQTSEAELESLRRDHQTSLPEQLDMNLQTLDRLATQQQTNSEAIDRSATTLFELQQELSRTDEYLAPAEVERVPVDPAVADYLNARNALDALRARGYKEVHPEVERAQRLVGQLEAQLPAGVDPEAVDPEVPGEPVPNPTYLDLEAKIRQAEAEQRRREADKDRIEDDIERYTRYVDETFGTEQMMAEVLRRTTALRERHESLQEMVDNAELTANAEVDQRDARFEIVDAANLPEAPTRPNKPAVLLAAILASLALSVGFGLAVDLAHQKIWTQSEIETLWGVPVLVDIPEIVTDADVAHMKKQRLALALSSVGATAVYVSLLYVCYLNSGVILQGLDPIIQRLVY